MLVKGDTAMPGGRPMGIDEAAIAGEMHKRVAAGRFGRAQFETFNRAFEPCMPRVHRRLSCRRCGAGNAAKRGLMLVGGWILACAE